MAKSEIEELTMLLTLFAYALLPNIDRGAAYELIMEMLMEGPTEESIESYASLIRHTAVEGGTKSVH